MLKPTIILLPKENEADEVQTEETEERKGDAQVDEEVKIAPNSDGAAQEVVEDDNDDDWEDDQNVPAQQA